MNSKPRLIHPKQVGPLTLPEVVDFFVETQAQNMDLSEMEEKLNRLSEELEERLGKGNRLSQRQMIKHIFEGPKDSTPNNPFELIYRQWLEESGEDGKDRLPIKFRYGPEMTPDYLAMYLSKSHFKSKHGIYFHVKNITSFLKRHSLNPGLSVQAIGVHELVHFFVESTMAPDKYKKHNHVTETPTWCRMEEASADRTAREWLLNSGGGKKSIKDIDDIDKHLFHPLYNGTVGLPGYGEWNLLDNNVLSILTLLLENNHHLPKDYSIKSIQFYDSWDFLFLRQKAESLWNSIIENMDDKQIPFFLDIVN